MCEYHLYLEVSPTTGTITFNHPEQELWELKETCALDLADQGEQTLSTIGKLLQVSRERARQIEWRGLDMLRYHPKVPALKPED